MHPVVRAILVVNCFVAIFAVGVHSSGYVQLEYDGKFRSRFRRRT